MTTHGMKCCIVGVLGMLVLIIAGCGGTGHRGHADRMNSELVKSNSIVERRVELSARATAAGDLAEGRLGEAMMRELKRGCPHADRNELAEVMVVLQRDVESIHDVNGMTKSVEGVCPF